MTCHAATIAVIGAGAWGTALARLLAGNGHEVRLWARRHELAREMARTRVNADYLPGARLARSILVSADGDEVLAGAEAAFMVVPSKGLREVLEVLPPAPAYVSCVKGLEPASLLRPSEIIAARWPESVVAALSGPNLAQEIAAGQPAASTVASPRSELATRVQGWLTQPSFRVYSSADLVGVEVAGAVKNVIALAAGMGDGLALGDNAKAAIITRGLAEMLRVGLRMGARAPTFYGLAGVGDLIATCHGPRSRNRSAGERLVKGGALQPGKGVAEGLRTVQALIAFAEREGLELPIARAVFEVVYGGKAAGDALRELMARDLKAEW